MLVLMRRKIKVTMRTNIVDLPILFCLILQAALMTMKQMLLIWRNLFDDGVGRSDSPDFRHPTGTLHVPSPTDRETMCKHLGLIEITKLLNSLFRSFDHGCDSFSTAIASFRAPSIAGSSTNTGTLNTGFRVDAALSEIASSVSMHVSKPHDLIDN